MDTKQNDLKLAAVITFRQRKDGMVDVAIQKAPLSEDTRNATTAALRCFESYFLTAMMPELEVPSE